MPDNKYKFGMIGLGTMGRNLLLNMTDHGFAGAGYDKNADQIALLEKEGEGKPVKGFTELNDFVQSLATPRAIMMLVPAGKIVDSVIEELIPLLEKGDIIIDGGNSHFTDTNVRVGYLESKGLHFFGMGISGGEEGARKGPSMMPGGDKEAYNFVKPVFEAIAAQVNGQPCVTYIGPGASGHFVKMVHNGIEYAIMQLISETYGLLKNGLGFDNDRIESIFSEWSKGKLQSFLIEITSDILKFKKPDSDHLLVDDIKDEARAKGTGKWTSQIAMDLETPIPSIDAAVSTRDLSKYKALRVELAALYADVQTKISTANQDEFVKQLEDAFYFSLITAYSQGMHMLYKASVAYNYKLNLGSIAQIWRGGCIIRSPFLEDIYQAYHKDDNLEHLYADPNVQQQVKETLPAIRNVVAAATNAGIAIPAFAASLNYFENFRTATMPSNLIQAQRDYFGAHTYELIGKEGVYHTVWTDVDKDAKEKP